ncbi:MAG: hypothetical protein ACD_62C00515G0001 [uncultured bacterium]|nr:MAG: hypothetical protein ACD_62C00515G0001 [uncultured bacterium]
MTIMKFITSLLPYIGTASQLPDTRPWLPAVSGPAAAAPVVPQDSVSTVTDPRLIATTSASFNQISSGHHVCHTTGIHRTVESPPIPAPPKTTGLQLASARLDDRAFRVIHLGGSLSQFQVRLPCPLRKPDDVRATQGNPIYQHTQQLVRDQLLRLFRVTHFRNSPFCPTFNECSVSFSFDLKTGALVTDPMTSEHTITAMVVADADKNEIELAEESFNELFVLMDRLRRNPEQYDEINTQTALAVITALIDLHAAPIVNPDATTPPKNKEAVVGISHEIHEKNIAYLRQESSGQPIMTYQGPVPIPPLAYENHEFTTGLYSAADTIELDLSLDDDGTITNSVANRPTINSPRGTLYTRGVPMTGKAIRLFCVHDDIIWYDANDFHNLNPKQQTAIRLLFERSHLFREEYLEAHPYAIDVLTSTTTGHFAQALFKALHDFKDTSTEALSCDLIETPSHSYAIIPSGFKARMIPKRIGPLPPNNSRTVGHLALRKSETGVVIDWNLSHDRQDLTEQLQPVVAYLQALYPTIFCYRKYQDAPFI